MEVNLLPPRLLRFGPFELDVRAGRITKHGVRIHLQDQSFQILLMLLEHPGEVVLREEIRQKLWPNNTIVEFDHSINAAIKRLRNALGESADDPRYIETLAKRGYRFLGEVERVGGLPAEPPAKPAEPVEETDLAEDTDNGDADDLSGSVISHYRVLEKLGSGGMGEVYRARDTKLDREVAIKVLPAGLAQNPEGLARFEREAKVLASLNHPNIATIYGIEELKMGRALAMELVEGATLKSPLPLKEAFRIAAQLAEALEAAHDKGIVHRDLKPANIMITPSGVVKVLDFGLAAVTQPPGVAAGDPSKSPTLVMPTQPGMIMGTAAYMSPEQAAGQPVDKRADIWAFGVLLWEMLTGQRLFPGDSVAHILAGVVGAPIDFDKLPKETPRAIRDLVKRCLDREVKTRLRDIGEARVAIQNVGKEPELPAIAASPSRFGRRGWLAVGVLAVAAAGLGFGFYRAMLPVPLKPLVRLDVSLGPDAVAGANSAVAISPDGARIVFPIRGANGKPLLASRLLDQPAITPLPGTENAKGAFFSPDGQWIGFFADNALKKVALHGGAPVTIADALGDAAVLEQSSFFGASWGENGVIVASVRGTGGLTSIPASGGAQQSVTKPGPHDLTHVLPQVLPGGNTVLFTASRGGYGLSEFASIEVVSLKTGKVKELLKGGYFGRYLATNGSTGHLVYVHQGGLYAVAFDPVGLEVRGMPEPILEDVVADTTGPLRYPFDFSRNGTFVYQAGVTDQKWPIVLMDSTGKTEPLVATPGVYANPAFSPDGKRLALLADDPGKGYYIFVYDRQRDAMTRLPFSGGLLPIWSPDGEHLVLPSSSAAGTRVNWIRADGSGETQVLLESKNGISASGFSSDGRRMVHEEFKGLGDLDIWTLPIDISDPDHPKPGKAVPFLQNQAGFGFVFSPDGRYVAYFSNESGQYETYVRPAPGPDGKPGPGKWQISTGGGSFPVWSPNGRELFYGGPDQRIMVTDYTTIGGSFSSSKPRVWSDRQIRRFGGFLNFTLAPDGKHFAVFPMPETKADDKGPAHVTFLLNFFDELRRRVPVGK